MTRTEGQWSYEIRRSELSQSNGDILSWSILQEKSTINFLSQNPTVIWEGTLDLEKNEMVSWAISNFGNAVNGQIVASSKSRAERSDDNLRISTCFFLEKRKNWEKTSNQAYHSLGFIGNVDYVLQ